MWILALFLSILISIIRYLRFENSLLYWFYPSAWLTLQWNIAIKISDFHTNQKSSLTIFLSLMMMIQTIYCCHCGKFLGGNNWARSSPRVSVRCQPHYFIIFPLPSKMMILRRRVKRSDPAGWRVAEQESRHQLMDGGDGVSAQLSGDHTTIIS